LASPTGIEWTETTWNPVTGCDRVSEGCDKCYALTLAKRLKAMGNVRYQHDGDPRTSGPGFGVAMHEDKLMEPLRWRAPHIVFVNSMSDLFHPKVTTSFIAAVFAVMAATPRHTYQVLTKRPARMASLTRSAGFENTVRRLAPAFGARTLVWPLPNVWLGVSVENQKRAGERIPRLLAAIAAIRFLSCEPLLGPIELEETVPRRSDLERISWVIVGGESGAGSRPMDPAWARSLRDQCLDAKIAFFMKQWGGRTPKAGGRELDGRTWDEMPFDDAVLV
jgi:protein gp37